MPRVINTGFRTVPAMAQPLTEVECRVLSLEDQRWKYPAVKEGIALEELGLTPARYYQVLNALIDRPEALEVAPQLVRRLQRIRAARQEARRARV